MKVTFWGKKSGYRVTFTSAISGIIVSVTSCGKQGNMSRMTLSDRIEIEAGIYARKSLSEIAEQIHKSRRYVSEELRRNATKVPGEHPLGKRCRNATGCRRGGLCGKENCHQMCYTCKEVDCQTVCKAYNDDPCKELQKPPYVCNVCSRRRKCKSDRVYYTAQQADDSYAASRTPQGVRGLKSERAIGVGRELSVAPSKGA